MDQVQAQFTALLEEKGITLNEVQLEQFEGYYRELVSWNEKMNLTGITEREEVYIKHFYDSLSLAFYVDMNKVGSLADIGSGAGFPGLPLKLAFPHLQLTIVDSLNKRITFLQHVADELKLEQVKLVHGRAEDIARQSGFRDSYDLVTARAVARMAVLNEFCLPFAKVGGMFAAMKGTDPSEEVKEAARSFKELKGKVKQSFQFELPVSDSSRHIILVNKVQATPGKYPRKAGTPLKSPLV
ncbi:16S rRNA (guanine(527)-N(7))-methyltransferase RsmG [Paenibacillus physcomitrellae]|uniref:Ribosomal RNA small subunit methyltransferase G n=1 Tax=Paenibacillus physcomitrellae TaxID=1619311 RepID=A0ABQ1GNY5_9BACL|nr:16S rRNA (guanine(527)-N(7))-methyltransferase RsmG [Paenibacillus physcomitrellae]GGA47321.1 ribosomal RNA small subunit methyltransferase G [Paenibacillus physcomitrellae]